MNIETETFLRKIARQVVEYEKLGMHELSKFTLELTMNMQTTLNMDRFMYMEFIRIFDYSPKTSVAFASAIPSECVRDYMITSALDAGDNMVRYLKQIIERLLSPFSFKQ